MKYAPTIIATCLLSFTFSLGYTDDGPIPQEHRITECKDDDEPRKLAWWKEYKPAILGEFRYWSGFKGDAEGENPIAATNDINEAIRIKAYRHHSWDIYTGVTGIQGVSQDELEAVVDGCRTAIIDMKYWLIWVSDEKKGQSEDRAGYEKAAMRCMKAQGDLRPVRRRRRDH